jgi:hypothetical protein
MDVVNFPTMLNEQLLFLKGALASADAAPTAGAMERLTDLRRAWQELEARRDQLLGTELSRFNSLFERNQVPAVVVPGRPVP